MAENSDYIVIEMYNKAYDLINRSPNHTISNRKILNSKISTIKNLTTKNYDLLLFKSFNSTKISNKERRISHSDSRDSENQILQRRSLEQVHFSDSRSPDSDRWLIDYKSPISYQKRSQKMSSTNLRFSNPESQKTESKSPNNGKVMLSVSQSLSNTGSDIVKQGYLYVKRPPGNRWNRFKVRNTCLRFMHDLLFFLIHKKSLFLIIHKKNPLDNSENRRKRERESKG